MNIKAGRYSIKFAKLPTLVFLPLLALLLSLGTWQLNRADEKQQLLVQQQANQTASPVPLSSTLINRKHDLRYRKLSVTGYYDTKQQILLDNQISEGKAGYFVLTPFVLQNEHKALLVNRGWILLTQNRTQLPNINMAAYNGVINGRANHFPSIGIKLAGAEIPSDTIPMVVGVIDIQVLEKKLGYELFDFQLELNPNEAQGFKRDWHTTSLMPPEQHIAYATQWFALAITLTLLFFIFSFKKSS